MIRSSRSYFRLSLYVFYELLLFFWLVSLWARYEGIPLKRQFHDVNPIQHVQEAHLGAASLLYLMVVASAYRKGSADEFRIYVPILCCLLWGTNRELDGVWERFELDRIYDSLKFITAIPGIVFLAFHGRSCWDGFLKIRSTRGFLYLVLGIGGYLAAQIVSEGLEALDVSRNYERATEESLELLFGAFFVFSGVEALIQIAIPRIPPAR